MILSRADLEAIRTIVRDELARLRRMKRKRRPCGTGSRVPECWGSAIHGPDGCYCRDRA